MSVLSPPRHLLVTEAIDTTRHLCHGQIIDGSTVLRHAVGVVLTLEQYMDSVSPETAAGIILHDVPDAGREETEIDHALSHFPEATLQIVRGIQQEHGCMAPGRGDGYNDALRDYVAGVKQLPGVLLPIAADKIVAFESFVRRVQLAPDEKEFWQARGAFRRRFPYFEGFIADTVGALPGPMSRDLGNIAAAISVRIAEHGPYND